MVTITHLVARTQSIITGAPADSLPDLLKSLSEQTPLVLYSDERTLSLPLDDGHRLGTKAVTAIYHDDSQLAKQMTKMQMELLDVKKNLVDVTNDLADVKTTQKADALIFGVPFLMNTAAQILLMAYGSQPKLTSSGDPLPSATYFSNFSKQKDPQSLKDVLTAVNSTATFPTTEQALATSFDNIIDRRNGTLHFANRHDLEQNAVTRAKGLLTRHPELRQTCRVESLVIDLFETIMTAYHR